MATNYNYFTSMEKQYDGEQWITLIRPEDIQRSAKRICKDMAKGSISYESSGKYFYDNKFLENFIIGVRNELDINSLNYSGCTFLYNYYPNIPNLSLHITHLERLNYIYTVILNKLEQVKYSGNIGYLADISGLLYNDRNHLN